jgi:hypothetical protein
VYTVTDVAAQPGNSSDRGDNKEDNRPAGSQAEREGKREENKKAPGKEPKDTVPVSSLGKNGSSHNIGFIAGC